MIKGSIGNDWFTNMPLVVRFAKFDIGDQLRWNFNVLLCDLYL